MNNVTITGIKTMDAPETRALLFLNVNYNGNMYGWQIFCDPNKSLDEFLNEDTKQKIYADIEKKELEWQNLNPKTRTIEDPFTNETITIDIQKDEIVRPDIPDYYAKRRNEYPSLGDQLDAIWKGSDSNEFNLMIQKIQEVKQKYPKN